ncbi:U3 small nucleolar RNA-associated protein 6-domain-containing protein [Xylogone sp. PMI_703]|nr:U3 small nucleolar RNA-associated protein 6-domain-containing protein [Xylogone sp. PMI_703]
MSGASDKARYYLEQAIPQLQEFEQKKIFTKEEIRTLVKKRSDFEHRVLARGSKPVDFARYAAWEIGLEQLRLKRCKRLRIKGSSAHAGQARVFNIFDRGTRKHPGDLTLWMSYLEYARQAKTTKKFKTILTSAIRLHPTKPGLWIYAAKWILENEADMAGARSYMQRGTRFCTTTREVWIEYAKLEMIYLAKIALRRKILGLDVDTPVQQLQEKGEEADEEGFNATEDMISIPEFKTPQIRRTAVDGIDVDTEAVKDPMATPALNGAIPLAIFDAARKQPFFCASAAADFFDMFSAFTQVACMSRILQHVLDCMKESYPADAFTCDCYIRQPFIHLLITSPEFPMALSLALTRLKESMDVVKDKNVLVDRSKTWINRLLASDKLDPGLRKVLSHTMKKLE